MCADHPLPEWVIGLLVPVLEERTETMWWDIANHFYGAGANADHRPGRLCHFTCARTLPKDGDGGDARMGEGTSTPLSIVDDPYAREPGLGSSGRGGVPWKQPRLVDERSSRGRQPLPPDWRWCRS